MGKPSCHQKKFSTHLGGGVHLHPVPPPCLRHWFQMPFCSYTCEVQWYTVLDGGYLTSTGKRKFEGQTPSDVQLQIAAATWRTETNSDSAFSQITFVLVIIIIIANVIIIIIIIIISSSSSSSSSGCDLLLSVQWTDSVFTWTISCCCEFSAFQYILTLHESQNRRRLLLVKTEASCFVCVAR